MAKIEVKIEPNCRRILEIEVDADQVAAEYQRQLAIYRGKANIPGFRPGKAPPELVKLHYADAIKADTLEESINTALWEAIQQQSLVPIERPRISHIEFELDQPLRFRAELEVRPQIELRRYKGFEVSRKVNQITDADVDEALRSLQESAAEFFPVERRSHGSDLVVVDLIRKSFSESETDQKRADNVAIDLGAEGVLPEFKDALTGTSIGEMKEISVAYPPDYQDKDLAGRKVTYLAVVKEVKEKKLPPLDDEFARRFDGIPDLASLRVKMRDNLERKAARQADEDFKKEIIKKVVEQHRFEVPESMVEEYLRRASADFRKRYGEVDELRLRQAYRPVAEDNLRWQFLYHEIARAEKIEVTESDRAAWVKGFAKAYNMPEAEARQALGQARRMDDIDDLILEQKVLDFLAENMITVA